MSSLQRGSKTKTVNSSVADPGWLFRIRIFPAQIPNPESKIPDPDPHKRILVFLSQKIVYKLSEI
jgi:hypothetical protein